MALPSIMRKLFRNDGYGPLLKPEIIPFAADLASKSADVAASTGWVKDLATADLYVDSSVASSGDGYSRAAAFKTIGEAVSAAKAKPGQYTKIFITGGTYTENVSIDHLFVIFELEGNTTINGRLYIYNSSVVGLNSSNGSSLTLNYTGNGSNTNNSAFIIRDNSHINLDVNLNITCNSACGDCLTFVSSSLYSSNAISCTVNGTVSRIFSANNNSIVSIDGDIGITTTANVDYFIYVSRCSSFILRNGVVHFNAPNVTYGVFCEQTAVIVLVDYTFNLTAKDCTVARFSSAICFYNSSSELWCSGWHNFDCGWNSCVYIINSNIKANSNASSESSVFVHTHSGFDIGGGSLVVNGSFSSGVLYCADTSLLRIQGDCTYSGSPIGPKWNVFNCSTINVASRVLSNLPGSQNGYTYPTSFGYIN